MNLQDKPIDYLLLAKAVQHYKDLRYKQIEVPWIVSPEASLVTAPAEGCFVLDDKRHLVGSAEQGFIHLLQNSPEKIEPNQYYYAISPCFRRDVPCETYSEWFIKLELFCWPKNMYSIDVGLDFIRDAKKLFSQIVDPKYPVEKNYIDGASIDLMYNNLELGSYGGRTLEDKLWVYGTGIALPRIQLCI